MQSASRADLLKNGMQCGWVFSTPSRPYELSLSDIMDERYFEFPPKNSRVVGDEPWRHGEHANEQTKDIPQAPLCDINGLWIISRAMKICTTYLNTWPGRLIATHQRLGGDPLKKAVNVKMRRNVVWRAESWRRQEMRRRRAQRRLAAARRASRISSSSTTAATTASQLLEMNSEWQSTMSLPFNVRFRRLS